MSLQHSPTPRLTPHAQERCAEMQVCTKRVKRMVQRPDTRVDSYDGCVRVTSESDPSIAVVYRPAEIPGGPVSVVTVLWRTYDKYVRNGATYTLKT